MNMIRAEEVLCELMRGPEYRNDVVVRMHIDSWRRGHGQDAGATLVRLVRDLSERNAKLTAIVLKAEQVRPTVILLDQAMPPPASTPGKRRCVPLSEAQPGDPVYLTDAGELVAQPRADRRAFWDRMREVLTAKPAADEPAITESR